MSSRLLKKFAVLLGVANLLTGVLACGNRTPTFHVSASSAAYGVPLQLSWAVPGAPAVEISGLGSFPGSQGSVKVQPPVGRTTFTLTAGATVQSVVVQVGGGVKVTQGTDHGYLTGTSFQVIPRSDSGQPSSVATEVQVTTPGLGGAVRTLTLACAANAPSCSFSFPQQPPEAGSYQVRVTGSGAGELYALDGVVDVLPLPTVTASAASSTQVTATWTNVPGAAAYRAQLYDFEANQALGGPMVVTHAPVGFTSPLPLGTRSAGVVVEALATAPDTSGDLARTPPSVSRATGFLDEVPGAPWQFHSSAEYQGDTLTLSFPALGADESVALITLNPTDGDHLTATLAVEGTLDPVNPPTPGPAALASERGTDEDPALGARDLARRGHDLVHAREQARAEAWIAGHGLPERKPATGLAALASTARFCVSQGLAGDYVRKTAMLVRATAHVAFYVDADDLAHYAAYAPSLWDRLATRWEDPIYPTDVGNFGAESDVDQNGHLLVFFTHELGAPTAHGLLLGYFSANDVSRASDGTEACQNGGSNGADIFYMNDIEHVLRIKPPTAADPGAFAADIYSDTLAHEFQHLINFNQKHLVAGGLTGEDTWINEGLSVTAEDMSGFGWHQYVGQRGGSRYLDRYPTEPNASAPLRYTTASLTHWEGDPVGNYEGAHSFFRYWADRHGDGSFKALVDTAAVGAGNLANNLGEPLERAMAEWTTALMFSNEAFSPAPRFNFTGPAWTPLHEVLFNARNCSATPVFNGRYGYVRYVPLTVATGATAKLRATGWNAFLTGAGTGGTAVVRVTGSSHPSVVAVRFSGTLPQGDWTPACP